ncbi:MAG: hypothetical protein KDK48_03435 [Chlamydiia bacterium]|nr:hypothetical protein [Chlamydiia bacterium]
MSDDLNTLLSNALKNGLGGITPPSDIGASGTQNAAAPAGVSGIAPTDTVSQANETKNKIVLALLGWEGQGPDVLNKDLLVFLYNEMTTRVVNHIVDQMAKSAKEMRELFDEEFKHKIRLGLEDFFGHTTDLQTNKEAALSDQSVFATLTLASVTSMMTMSATVLGQVSLPTVALHGLHPSALSGLDQSVQPLLLASGAFISVGLTAPVLRTIALASQKAKLGPGDGAVGKAYGIQVARAVMAGYIEDLVKTVFAAKPEAVTKQLIDKVELSYLFGALVAVERASTGWINLEEMVSLLTEGAVYQGIKKDNPSDPRLVIVGLIQERLKGMDPKERALFILSHLDHYKDSKEIEDLEQHAELINNFWKNYDYEQITENRA